MTDEELIARLHLPWPIDGNVEEVTLPVWVLELTGEAADRIEALLEQCEGLAQVVDYNWVKHQRVIAAEAKLAKAVEAVDKVAALIEERHVVHMTAKGRNPKDYTSDWSLIAKEVRAALAEIKGESHE